MLPDHVGTEVNQGTGFAYDGDMPSINQRKALVALSAGMLAFVAVRAFRSRPWFSFAGRTVLITGGARGLGFALARRLTDEGAHVVLVSRSPTELDRAVEILNESRGSAVGKTCDIRDIAALTALVNDVVRDAGRLDVVINNAGVIQSMPFARTEIEDFRESLDTHFWAPLHLIKAALPHLTRGEGRIINIGSFGGRVAVPHLLPYCVGKFAEVALSDGLNAELASDGISVLTVTPGLMRTGSHRNVKIRGEHKAEARVFALADATPLTSMAVDRAAKQILEASRRRRARVTPGIQARVAEILNMLTPETTAAVMARTASVLPGPGGGDGQRAVYSRDLDLGWTAALFPTRAAIEMNQPVAADEAP